MAVGYAQADAEHQRTGWFRLRSADSSAWALVYVQTAEKATHPCDCRGAWR